MPKHLKDVSTASGSKTSRQEKKDKGLGRAQEKLRERRKEREEYDRQAQEAAEDKNKEGREINGAAREADRKGQEGKLKAERAKVQRLIEELQASQEEELRLQEDLSSFRIVVSVTRRRFINTLSLEAVRLALVTSLSELQSQHENISKMNHEIRLLEDDIKDWMKRKSREKSPLLSIDEMKLQELRERLRETNGIIERLEKKLVKVETERDSCRKLVQSASKRASMLEQHKKRLECTFAERSEELSRAKLEQSSSAPTDGLYVTDAHDDLLDEESKDWRTIIETKIRIRAQEIMESGVMESPDVLKSKLLGVNQKLLMRQLSELKSQLETAVKEKEESARKNKETTTSTSSIPKSTPSDREWDLESAARLAQKKVHIELIRKLASELESSNETIAELRRENTALLLKVSGIE